MKAQRFLFRHFAFPLALLSFVALTVRCGSGSGSGGAPGSGGKSGGTSGAQANAIIRDLTSQFSSALVSDGVDSSVAQAIASEANRGANYILDHQSSTQSLALEKATAKLRSASRLSRRAVARQAGAAAHEVALTPESRRECPSWGCATSPGSGVNLATPTATPTPTPTIEPTASNPLALSVYMLEAAIEGLWTNTVSAAGVTTDAKRLDLISHITKTLAVLASKTQGATQLEYFYFLGSASSVTVDLLARYSGFSSTDYTSYSTAVYNIMYALMTNLPTALGTSDPSVLAQAAGWIAGGAYYWVVADYCWPNITYQQQVVTSITQALVQGMGTLGVSPSASPGIPAILYEITMQGMWALMIPPSLSPSCSNDQTQLATAAETAVFSSLATLGASVGWDTSANPPSAVQIEIGAQAVAGLVTGLNNGLTNQKDPTNYNDLALANKGTQALASNASLALVNSGGEPSAQLATFLVPMQEATFGSFQFSAQTSATADNPYTAKMEQQFATAIHAGFVAIPVQTNGVTNQTIQPVHEALAKDALAALGKTGLPSGPGGATDNSNLVSYLKPMASAAFASGPIAYAKKAPVIDVPGTSATGSIGNLVASLVKGYHEGITAITPRTTIGPAPTPTPTPTPTATPTPSPTPTTGGTASGGSSTFGSVTYTLSQQDQVNLANAVGNALGQGMQQYDTNDSLLSATEAEITIYFSLQASIQVFMSCPSCGDSTVFAAATLSGILQGSLNLFTYDGVPADGAAEYALQGVMNGYILGSFSTPDATDAETFAEEMANTAMATLSPGGGLSSINTDFMNTSFYDTLGTDAETGVTDAFTDLGDTTDGATLGPDISSSVTYAASFMVSVCNGSGGCSNYLFSSAGNFNLSLSLETNETVGASTGSTTGSTTGSSTGGGTGSGSGGGGGCMGCTTIYSDPGGNGGGLDLPTDIYVAPPDFDGNGGGYYYGGGGGGGGGGGD